MSVCPKQLKQLSFCPNGEETNCIATPCPVRRGEGGEGSPPCVEVVTVLRATPMTALRNASQRSPSGPTRPPAATFYF